MKIQQLQTIQIKYLGWTNTQPERLKLLDTRFNKSIIIPLDGLKGDDLKDKAINYLLKVAGAINIHSYSLIKEGIYNIHVSFTDLNTFENIFNK